MLYQKIYEFMQCIDAYNGYLATKMFWSGNLNENFKYITPFYNGISDPLTEDIALDILERFFYRPGHKGFSYMVDIFQIYWLGILSLALVSKSPDTESFSVYSIYIALMGATMFTALFEAQARYIFIWAPLYILAMCGFKDYSGLQQ